MEGNNVKNHDENHQLSCGKYTSHVAARLSLQRLSRRAATEELYIPLESKSNFYRHVKKQYFFAKVFIYRLINKNTNIGKWRLSELLI